MKRFGIPFLRRFLRDEWGQSAALAIVTLTTMMALAATSVETGHVYYAYRQLVSSTNAATLAGAQGMPNIGSSSDGASAGTAWGNINAYSSIPGGLNATSMLGETSGSITATFTCGSTATSLNVSCQIPTSGSCTSGSTCNTIAVTQKATVNLWFGGLVGLRSMTIKATATASMRGGTDIPYNIAVIIDTTNSMTATAPAADGCGSHATQILCAVSGLATMLGSLDPCALNTTCGSGTAFVDDVALFVFPALNSGSTYSANSYNQDYCGSGDPTVPYNFQNVSASPAQLNLVTTTTNGISPGAYEIIPFSNDYRANDSLGTPLSTASQLVKAAGVGCTGLTAPGGQGTFYAQVVYAAETALETEKTSYPGSKNILIILSDGNASACNQQTSTGNNCSSGHASEIVAANCPSINGTSGSTPCTGSYTGQPLNGTDYSYTTGSGKNQVVHAVDPTGYLSTTYPSALGQCGQAVQAAQYATLRGTIVYTVAMGSPTSGGCTTDTTYTTSSGSTYGANAWPNGGSRQPCDAIGAMASNGNTFFSDDVTASGSSSGCSASGGNVNYTTMAEIFAAIGNGLTAPRLIPNNP